MKKTLAYLFIFLSVVSYSQTNLNLGRIDTIWANGQVPRGLNLTNTWFTVYPKSVGKTIYVDSANGSDVTGLRGTLRPFATVTAAQTAASNGDQIIIRPGTYTSTSLGKEGVYYYWQAGSKHRPTSGSRGYLVSNDTCYIDGYYDLSVTNANSIRVDGTGVLIMNARKIVRTDASGASLRVANSGKLYGTLYESAECGNRGVLFSESSVVYLSGKRFISGLTGGIVTGSPTSALKGYFYFDEFVGDTHGSISASPAVIFSDGGYIETHGNITWADSVSFGGAITTNGTAAGTINHYGNINVIGGTNAQCYAIRNPAGTGSNINVYGKITGSGIVYQNSNTTKTSLNDDVVITSDSAACIVADGELEVRGCTIKNYGASGTSGCIKRTGGVLKVVSCLLERTNVGVDFIGGTIGSADVRFYFADNKMYYIDQLQNAGYVLTSDAEGQATWQPNGGGAGGVDTIKAGTGISIANSSGSYTVTNTAPDQTVSIAGAGTTTVSGTYPTFTVTGQTAVTSITGTANQITVSGTTTPTLSIPAAAKIATSLTVPNVIGGTATTSPLNLQSTSGVGTTGADIVFKVGNNGATEAGRILNSGDKFQVPNTYNIGVNGSDANILLDGNEIVLSTDGSNYAESYFDLQDQTFYMQSPYGYMQSDNNAFTITSGSTNGLVLSGSPTLISASGSYINLDPRVAINTTSPTARLHIGSNPANPGDGQLKLDSSGLMAIPEKGLIENGGTHLYWTDRTSTRRQLDQQSAGGSGTVTSVTVTANQGVSGVVTNPTTTPSIQLSLGTLTGAVWNGSLITGTYGGTGINNGSNTITLGGNLTTSGAFNSTLTATAATNVTLPTSGTLYGTASGSITSSQLATSLSDETGTGLAVFNTAPTFTTSITTPLIIGGTAAGATLELRSTSGTGSGDLVKMTGGTNGGTTFGTFNLNGLGVGTTATSNSQIIALRSVAGQNDIYIGNSNTGTTSTCGIQLNNQTTQSNITYSSTGYTPSGIFLPNQLRVIGGSSGGLILTLSNSSSGADMVFATNVHTERMRITKDGLVTVGIMTGVAKFNVLSTTEQIRSAYDASNYLSVTTGSTGGVTYDAVGSGAAHTFSDVIIPSAGIKGTTTNDNATALNVGEFASSLIASGSAVTFTTTVAMNVTSISLTAGDWDVEGNINFAETTATVSARSGGITSTSATVPTDGTEVYCGVQSTLVTETNSITVPRKRLSLSGTTTVYLVANATFSAGTCTGYGAITARRVR